MSIGGLFIIFAVLILLGVPIYVSLSVSSLAYLITHPAIPILTSVKSMAEGLDSFTLLAIPFFILAGKVMNESGMTKRLFQFARSIVGYLPGGLGHVNILTSMIFAGMSGSAIADAGGIGAMQVISMKENGYDTDFSVGVTASSSLIGPIIPPSIPMLVYASLAGCSISKLFMAGLIPGVLMGIALMIMVCYYTKKRGYPCDTGFSFREIGVTFLKAFWGILAPVILLGGIFTGIFTPTEGACIIIIYSLVIGGFVYKGLTRKKLLKILIESVESTVTITLILASSATFAWILAYEGAPQRIASVLLSLTDNRILICMLIMLLMLIIGTFMEAGAAMVILLPVILPITDMVGVDRIHLGILVVLTLMIGLLTPPVGLVLFILARTLKIPVGQVMKGTAPWLVPLVIVAIATALIPQLSLWLPGIIGS